MRHNVKTTKNSTKQAENQEVKIKIKRKPPRDKRIRKYGLRDLLLDEE